MRRRRPIIDDHHFQLAACFLLALCFLAAPVKFELRGHTNWGVRLLREIHRVVPPEFLRTGDQLLLPRSVSQGVPQLSGVLLKDLMNPSVALPVGFLSQLQASRGAALRAAAGGFEKRKHARSRYKKDGIGSNFRLDNHVVVTQGAHGCGKSSLLDLAALLSSRGLWRLFSKDAAMGSILAASVPLPITYAPGSGCEPHMDGVDAVPPDGLAMRILHSFFAPAMPFTEFAALKDADDYVHDNEAVEVCLRALAGCPAAAAAGKSALLLLADDVSELSDSLEPEVQSPTPTPGPSRRRYRSGLAPSTEVVVHIGQLLGNFPSHQLNAICATATLTPFLRAQKYSERPYVIVPLPPIKQTAAEHMFARALKLTPGQTLALTQPQDVPSGSDASADQAAAPARGSGATKLPLALRAAISDCNGHAGTLRFLLEAAQAEQEQAEQVSVKPGALAHASGCGRTGNDDLRGRPLGLHAPGPRASSVATELNLIAQGAGESSATAGAAAAGGKRLSGSASLMRLRAAVADKALPPPLWALRAAVTGRSADLDEPLGDDGHPVPRPTAQVEARKRRKAEQEALERSGGTTPLTGMRTLRGSIAAGELDNASISFGDRPTTPLLSTMRLLAWARHASDEWASRPSTAKPFVESDAEATVAAASTVGAAPGSPIAAPTAGRNATTARFAIADAICDFAAVTAYLDGSRTAVCKLAPSPHCSASSAAGAGTLAGEGAALSGAFNGVPELMRTQAEAASSRSGQQPEGTRAARSSALQALVSRWLRLRVLAAAQPGAPSRGYEAVDASDEATNGTASGSAASDSDPASEDHARPCARALTVTVDRLIGKSTLGATGWMERSGRWSPRKRIERHPYCAHKKGMLHLHRQRRPWHGRLTEHCSVHNWLRWQLLEAELALPLDLRDVQCVDIPLPLLSLLQPEPAAAAQAVTLGDLHGDKATPRAADSNAHGHGSESGAAAASALLPCGMAGSQLRHARQLPTLQPNVVYTFRDGPTASARGGVDTLLMLDALDSQETSPDAADAAASCKRHDSHGGDAADAAGRQPQRERFALAFVSQLPLRKRHRFSSQQKVEAALQLWRKQQEALHAHCGVRPENSLLLYVAPRDKQLSLRLHAALTTLAHSNIIVLDERATAEWFTPTAASRAAFALDHASGQASRARSARWLRPATVLQRRRPAFWYRRRGAVRKMRGSGTKPKAAGDYEDYESEQPTEEELTSDDEPTAESTAESTAEPTVEAEPAQSAAQTPPPAAF